VGGLDDQGKKGGTRAFGTVDPSQSVDPAAPAAPLAGAGTSKTVAAPGGAPVAAAMGAGPPPAAGTGAPTDGGANPPSDGSPGDDPLVGQTLVGRYFIERKLGEGGMGAVYLATHVALEKRVALKVLHGEFARKQDLIERFLQEAKAASRIRHDNVIDITDFGQTEDGWVFFAMELLDGSDLSEVLNHAILAGEVFPWARTKPIFLQVCSALSAAHSQGIIHRDLKPENIYLVERYGQTDFVKLLDFGIAKLTEVSEEGKKLTRTGMLFGTPEYMSPEQARGEKVDLRVDVYAMGCILFQMVVGRVPFEADNFMGILTKHLTEATPTMGEALGRAGAPAEIEAIVQKALAKERDDRWATIDEMADAIASLNDGVEVNLARPTTATAAAAPAASTAAPVGQARTQWTGSVRLDADADPGAAQKKSGPPVAVIAGGALVAVIVAVVLAMGGGGDDAQVEDSGAPAAAAAPDVAPPPQTTPETVVEKTPDPAPEAPAMVVVSITSEPAGADVIDASGQVIGKTPHEMTVEKSDQPLTFSVQKRGFEDQQIVVVPSEPSNAKEASLVRKRRTGRRGDDKPDDKPDDGLKNPFDN